MEAKEELSVELALVRGAGHGGVLWTLQKRITIIRVQRWWVPALLDGWHARSMRR